MPTVEAYACHVHGGEPCTNAYDEGQRGAFSNHNQEGCHPKRSGKRRILDHQEDRHLRRGHHDSNGRRDHRRQDKGHHHRHHREAVEEVDHQKIRHGWKGPQMGHQEVQQHGAEDWVAKEDAELRRPKHRRQVPKTWPLPMQGLEHGHRKLGENWLDLHGERYVVQQTQDEGSQVQAAQQKCPVQQMRDEDGELEAEWAPDVELVRVAESEQEEREEVLQWQRYPEVIP